MAGRAKQVDEPVEAVEVVVEGSSGEPGTVEEAAHVCMCANCAPLDGVREAKNSEPPHMCQNCYKAQCIEYV